ncbi:MAG: hypothetical protein AAGD14_15995 [Planctomycetota bacterium]
MKYLALIPFLALLACAAEEPVPSTGASAAASSGPSFASFELTGDAGKPMTILGAKDAAPLDEAVVEGRVWYLVSGFASFKMMDLSLDYCGELNKEDKCPTPWDYCCDPPEERQRHTLVVTFFDEDGKPARMPKMEGLRLLDHLVVKGKVEKDEFGNVSIRATGWQRVQRPELPDYVRFPKE